MSMMSPKKLLDAFYEIYKPRNINYAYQMQIAKGLVQKYSEDELLYALDYFNKRGISIYSLAYLRGNMEEACSLLKAEKFMDRGGEDSGSRNWKRVVQNSKAKHREVAPKYLFEESGETD
jgi:hypothetical protein